MLWPAAQYRKLPVTVDRGAYRILVGKPDGKRPLGRPRRGLEDNIKMYLRETEWGGMDWIALAQDRDQWRTLMNDGNEPLGFIKCWECLE
jgi:hypothetical protein